MAKSLKIFFLVIIIPGETGGFPITYINNETL